MQYTTKEWEVALYAVVYACSGGRNKLFHFLYLVAHNLKYAKFCMLS